MTETGDAGKSPEVTVIIPAYNAQRHLGRTLDSVLAQRGVEFEVEVVDDCSTDATRELVLSRAAQDARLRYRRTSANFGGPAGPRNLGVEHASSEWVAFCDADDLWHPDRLRRQLDCARDNSATLVCSTIYAFLDGNDPRFAGPLDPVAYQHISLWQMLLKNRVATSSVLCRRLPLRELGGFNTARGMVAVEDYDLWLRLIARLNAKVVRVAPPLVAYRLLPGSLSSSKWLQALKILRVHRSIFAIKGWHLAFPLAAPFLLTCYITSWLYIRYQITRES